MKQYREYMPEQARDICDVIGVSATIALVQRYGGQRLFIPNQSAPSYIKLVECIGEAAACLLSSYASGDRLTIPLCTRALRAKRNDELRAEFDRLTIHEKKSASEAVNRLTRFFEQPLHERHIWRILKSISG